MFAGAALATIGVIVILVVRAGPPEMASPPAADTPAVRIAKAATFEQAIAIARPALVDTTDEFGEGAQLLATYATAKLRWSDVAVTAETTLARVAKDPALERGKRLCVTGEIVRIAPRDLGRRRVHVGELRTTEAQIVFVAVGTTGTLATHRTATLCGAALGMSGSAVSILGMFDFEENRRPLVEQ